MRVTFLLVFDNTLVANDAARERLLRETDRVLGAERSKTYWALYESVRAEKGYVDFLTTLARYHDVDHEAPAELDRVILDFPYADVLYPETLSVIAALWSHGVVVVLSDGDAVFQPLKIARAGVANAVRGNVLVFAHKEARLEDVRRLFPAERYIAVDDKAEVLSRVKVHWGDLVRTVHVLQGKYADDPYDGPPPDLVVKRLGDLTAAVGRGRGAGLFDDEMTTAARGQRRGG